MTKVNNKHSVEELKKLWNEPVSAVMQKRFVSFLPSAPIQEAVVYLATHPEDAVPVLDGKKFKGEIRSADLLKTLINLNDLSLGALTDYGFGGIKEWNPRVVKDIMRTHEVVISPTATVESVIMQLLQGKDAVIPVVDEKDNLVGIVTAQQILQKSFQ